MNLNRRRMLIAGAAAALLPAAALADGDDTPFGAGFPFNRGNGNPWRNASIGNSDINGGTSVVSINGDGFNWGGGAVSISVNNGRWSGWFTTSLRLAAVGSVNGGASGTDLSATNPGADPLGLGAVVPNQDGQVAVALRNAQPNATYDVRFERFQDHGLEPLGQITTDSDGHFTGMTPTPLNNPTVRVGAFLLARSGQDEFVTVV